MPSCACKKKKSFHLLAPIRHGYAAAELFFPYGFESLLFLSRFDPTEFYTLSLHDALPISVPVGRRVEDRLVGGDRGRRGRARREHRPEGLRGARDPPDQWREIGRAHV